MNTISKISVAVLWLALAGCSDELVKNPEHGAEKDIFSVTTPPSHSLAPKSSVLVSVSPNPIPQKTIKVMTANPTATASEKPVFSETTKPTATTLATLKPIPTQVPTRAPTINPTPTPSPARTSQAS